MLRQWCLRYREGKLAAGPRLLRSCSMKDQGQAQGSLMLVPEIAYMFSQSRRCFVVVKFELICVFWSKHFYFCNLDSSTGF